MKFKENAKEDQEHKPDLFISEGLLIKRYIHTMFPGYISSLITRKQLISLGFKNHFDENRNHFVQYVFYAGYTASKVFTLSHAILIIIL